MALTYTEMASQYRDESFLQRVEMALLQDVNANRLQATPPVPTAVAIADQRDRLGRAAIANPHAYALKFASLVAEQLISKATLLDPAVTTDGDIFSAVSAVYDKCLPTL